MLKVVFIGGLTNGKIVYDYLKSNKFVSLELAITYPDGINKPNAIAFPNDENVIKDVNANNHINAIKEIDADYIFVAGWSELLNADLLQCAKSGIIGFHPSRLPLDRGRSVLAWQIEEGYEETALSMFYYNNLPDCGDIIAQEMIEIDFEDTIKDVLTKIDAATFNLMKAYFPLLRKGLAPRVVQNVHEGNFRRLRGDKDSEIKWNSNSVSIYNKVRAITHPYPGAIAVIGDEAFRIWKCEIINFGIGKSLTPGSVVATLFDDSLIIKSRDGFVRVREYNKLAQI